MGRTQRNGTASGAKRGARSRVSALKNERVTRSSRARLTSGLDDPAQVERELNEQLKQMGLYAANTTGDGNCLFRALSDQLYGSPAQHARLRQETCDHLASHADRFAAFVDDRPFDDYVRLMRENGTYGGHLELHAFAQMTQKRIKIVQPGLVYVVSAEDESPEAVKAREAKERERLRIQDTIAPGTEGPPPSDREQRRLKREESRQRKKQSAQALASKEEIVIVDSAEPAAAAAAAPAAPTPAPPAPEALVEAYGPLYIAYHNWEHYSSIRNLDGPHTGLPRIKERLPEAADDNHDEAESDTTKAKAGIASDEAATSVEKMVMDSTRGQYSLAEVRALLQGNNQDWAQVVEILVEREIAQDEERVGAELQAVLADEPGQSTGAKSLTPPTSLPDHMRWRATSPASVDTSVTQSSGEGDSPSTHTTTEEGIDPGSRPPSIARSSRANTPAADRLSTKRLASADLSAIHNLRGPKRRSQSRSSEEEEEQTNTPPSSGDERAPSPVAERSQCDGQGNEVYEIIKRGRGRPRKDGLPNKSSVAIKRKVPTPREKRDAAIARKRERQLEKVAKAKEPSPATAQSKAATEVRGFRELKI
ncbi:hypothetical protein ACQY0O_001328 [Thecaphora frezii]